jgi:hypothetical protein
MYDLNQLLSDATKVVLPSDAAKGALEFSHTRFSKEADYRPSVELVSVFDADFLGLAVEALTAALAHPGEAQFWDGAHALGVWMARAESAGAVENGLWLLHRLAQEGATAAMLDWPTFVLADMPHAPHAREAVAMLRGLLSHPSLPPHQLARVWAVYGEALVMGHGCEPDGRLGMEFLLRAADADVPHAFLKVAACLACPSISPDSNVLDVAAAVRWLERGVSLGAQGCHAFLGVLHVLGCMEGADWDRGLALLRLSAMDDGSLACDVLELIGSASSRAEVSFSDLCTIWRLAGMPLGFDGPQEFPASPGAGESVLGSVIAGGSATVPVLAASSTDALWGLCGSVLPAPLARSPFLASSALMSQFPIGMAFSLASLCPDLLKRPSLRLLVLGAELMEASSLYELIPLFLGHPALSLDVTLVGPSLPDLPLSGLFGHRSVVPHCFVGSAADFLAAHPDSSFDVVFLPHPGLESHAREWLEGDEDVFASFLSQGVPVLGCSYARDEAAVDAEVFSLFGFSVSDAIQNPLSFGGRGAALAQLFSCVWQLVAKGKALPADLLDTRLSLIERAREILGPYSSTPDFVSQAGGDMEAMGSLVLLKSGSGQRRPYFRLVRGFVVNADGDVYRRLGDSLVGSCEASLPARLVRNAPKESSSYVQRMLWAAAVWFEVVVPAMANDSVLAFHAMVGGEVLPDADELDDLADSYDVDLDAYLDGLGG